jgi:hypothetical protein
MPEIDVEMSNGIDIASFMTAEGDPEWRFIRRDQDQTTSIGVTAGRLELCDKTRLQS